MPYANGQPALDALARKWLALAQRRLLYLSEIYLSGRWRRYYATREEFAAQMFDAIKQAKTWAVLARSPKPAPGDQDDLRPAA
jgi:uncharacterized repeat protein (TIGR03809 family)